MEVVEQGFVLATFVGDADMDDVVDLLEIIFEIGALRTIL